MVYTVKSHRQRLKPTVPSQPEPEKPVAVKCIDVSYAQGKLTKSQWQKIRNAMDHCIIRASVTYGRDNFTLDKDSQFDNNVKLAAEVGMKSISAYHLSQALTVAEAKAEAKYLCKIIKDTPVNGYVICDFETFKDYRLSPSSIKKIDCNAITKAFCDVVASYGYSPCIYANTSTLNSYITNPAYPVWVAQYASKCTYKKPYVMWQYTSSGKVDGISGNVDLSYVYEEPKIPDSKPEIYTGNLPVMRVVKTAQDVISDALAWGKWIVDNNLYHYGEYGNKAYITPGSKYYEGGKYKAIYNVTHSSGCHFCETEERRKKKDARALGFNAENWEHTYVCNTFVTAMFAHGGMDPTCYKFCSQGSCIGMNVKGRATKLDNSKYWKYMGKLAIKDLEPGDVLVSSGHMQCVYAKVSDSKTKIIEATSYIGKYGSDASKKSIRIKTKKPSYTSVYRFTGSVDADIPIRHGEYSDRVKLWQAFLNWAGFNCGSVDGKFGDNTLAQTKKFQKKAGLTADGIIGPKTLEMATNTKK